MNLDKNNPEIRQQLYGGEISDYYKDVKKDNQPSLSQIYDRILKSGLRLNSSNNPDNKLK